MNNQKNEIFGIHRTTLLVIAVAITFGSFSVYKALGGGTSTVGRTERSKVPAVTATVSGTALAAGVDVSRTNTNPLTSATRLTNAQHPAVKTDLIPIEQIQVGDRVLAVSPTGEER
jgi:UDP-N-acetylglucosamine enolpyruvyl transferase